MSRLSVYIVLHESEAKLRTSVNNNDNVCVQWDLSDFIPRVVNVHNIM